jgi:leucyl/phenylalanyl-tRNA--protein transferase
MPTSRFPDWESFEFPAAAENADAPVAFCADLSPASVLGAYRRGIIPLPVSDEYFRTLNEFRYEDQVAAGTIALVGDEAADPYWVAWWSPDPRPVIGAGEVHLGRNVRKRLRRDALSTTADAAFGEVAEACRQDREPRWLTDPLLESLIELHRAGWAHSFEVWRGDELVGGAMGIGLDGLISGDSLFGRQPGGRRDRRRRHGGPPVGVGRDAHRRAVGRPAAALPGRGADATRALPAAARPPAGATVAPGRPAAGRPPAPGRPGLTRPQRPPLTTSPSEAAAAMAEQIRANCEQSPSGD